MKKIYLWSLFLISISVLVFSCRKDYKNFFDQKDNIASDLEAAKIFHAKGAYLNKATYAALMAQGTKGVLSNEKTAAKSVFFKLSPLWKDAFEVKAYDGSDLIVVPTPENRLNDKKFEIRRFFIFTKKNGSIVDGRIVEFLGVQYPLKDKMDGIIANYKNSSVLDLTGAIFEYDLNYFFLNGEKIEQGKRTGLFSKFNNLGKAITQSNLKTNDFSSGPMDPNVCYELYWCTYDGYGNMTSADFIGYSDGCYSPSSSGSGSGYDSASAYQSGGAPYAANQPPPTSVNNIINTDSLKAKFPCAVVLVVDKLNQLPVYTDFVQPFTTAQKPDLNWNSKPLTWNQLNSSGSYDYKLAEESVSPNSSTGQSRDIVLNKNMLQNSSQLLITAGAVHETLHAYIGNNIAVAEYNVQNGYNDYGSWFAALDAFYTVRNLPPNYSGHYQMLSDYFDKAVGILSAWDNNQHTQKEYVMAMLYGLNTVDPNCPTDMKNRLDNVFNDKKSTYKISNLDLNNFNSDNLNAPASKRLPASGCN